ncbi:hypothetical protein SPHINGOT1_280076 [Sphingomonas sp. T1]|nr:hypothetical protein SPHINGOT1_280076 [Sphingomonas sp. T1]
MVSLNLRRGCRGRAGSAKKGSLLPEIWDHLTVGAAISWRYDHTTWQVEGISHERRARTVGEALCRVPSAGCATG